MFGKLAAREGSWGILNSNLQDPVLAGYKNKNTNTK